MLPTAQALIAEIDAELPATRRVLERVPAECFGWRPHPKSLSAGQLAQHVATIPGGVAHMAAQDGFDVSTRPADYASCDSAAALLATLDRSAAAVREFLAGLDETRATAPWRLSFGDREIFTIPRLG
ncbi:MAG: DinB family protein, partial [Trebonia sp.]